MNAPNILKIGLLALTIASCHNMATPSKNEILDDYKGINLQGDSINLHSFYDKNKILLVNFWAGWCGDCLQHNPELVALYDRYKDFEINGKTIDIISISLDKNEQQWRRNIIRQNLYWPNHIADMKGYDSEQIKSLGIDWIPTNFLLDENGVIIAKNVDRSNIEGIIRNHYK